MKPFDVYIIDPVKNKTVSFQPGIIAQSIPGAETQAWNNVLKETGFEPLDQPRSHYLFRTRKV